MVHTIFASNWVAVFFAGSRTLSMWSAVAIAAVFEFLGAMLLGGSVTKTIAGGIAKPATFAKFPQLFMFGMLTAETG
jgi:sodium-dependent phosphate transporter